MIAKIKKTKTNRGRPKKDFIITAVKKNIDNYWRWRGRPKKEKKFDDSINTKISNHNKEINKISRENEKMHLEIKSTSFVNKKIKKKDNKKSDNFALWLLIFSMILFIFSLYKTFYIKPYNNLDNYEAQKNVDTEITLDTWIALIKDVSQNEEVLIIESWMIAKSNIIWDFYQNINDKKFAEISNMVDSYLKNSNVFRTYYNQNWLSKFLWNLVNEKIYVTNIKEKIVEWQKDGVSNYTYTIKYKIKDNNELFKEERETAIVTKNEKILIGSLRCITTWCSKMPFFNPK